MKILSVIFLFVYRMINKIIRESGRYAAIRQGLVIGEGSIFVGAQNFGSEPYLIKIGDNCLITDGVSFITHDGAIQVPFIKDGLSVSDVYSKKSTFGCIAIGDNVFIGVGSIILPNTKISSNCIVAAGSVVTGEFESGVVIGGNPAKIICSLEDYYSRNADRVIDFTGAKNRKSLILNGATLNGR